MELALAFGNRERKAEMHARLAVLAWIRGERVLVISPREVDARDMQERIAKILTEGGIR